MPLWRQPLLPAALLRLSWFPAIRPSRSCSGASSPGGVLPTFLPPPSLPCIMGEVHRGAGRFLRCHEVTHQSWALDRAPANSLAQNEGSWWRRHSRVPTLRERCRALRLTDCLLLPCGVAPCSTSRRATSATTPTSEPLPLRLCVALCLTVLLHQSSSDG